MQKFVRVDVNGIYVEDELFEDNVIPVDEDIITVEVPEGFYLPKWDGVQWVEGLSAAELDAIINAPAEPDPDEELANAITNATTLDELKSALLGSGNVARVKGKMK
jgi:hypothetical protein